MRVWHKEYPDSLRLLAMRKEPQGSYEKMVGARRSNGINPGLMGRFVNRCETNRRSMHICCIVTLKIYVTWESCSTAAAGTGTLSEWRFFASFANRHWHNTAFTLLALCKTHIFLQPAKFPIGSREHASITHLRSSKEMPWEHMRVRENSAVYGYWLKGSASRTPEMQKMASRRGYRVCITEWSGPALMLLKYLCAEDIQ